MDTLLRPTSQNALAEFLHGSRSAFLDTGRVGLIHPLQDALVFSLNLGSMFLDVTEHCLYIVFRNVQVLRHLRLCVPASQVL
jgi:hypothetical protein